MLSLCFKHFRACFATEPSPPSFAVARCTILVPSPVLATFFATTVATTVANFAAAEPSPPSSAVATRCTIPAPSSALATFFANTFATTVATFAAAAAGRASGFDVRHAWFQSHRK